MDAPSRFSDKAPRWLLAEGGGSGRMEGLDALRGILALGVMGYHLSVWTKLFASGTWLNMTFSKFGNIGVSAFFVLSGFVAFRLTDWEKLQKEGLRRYYLKRWLRLAPVFYLAVGLNLIFQLGMGPGPSPRMILENVTLIFGAIHPNHALLIGGWFVGVVALLYIAFPLLAWLRHRLGPWFLVVLTLGLWAWSLEPTLHGVMAIEDGNARFNLYVMPQNQLWILALGGVLAELHRRASWRLAWPAATVLSALLLTWLLWIAPRFYDHLVAMTGWLRYRYVLTAAAIILVTALKGGVAGALTRFFGWVGTWSYPAFLLHAFYHVLWVRLFHLQEGWLAFWAAVVPTVITAILVERYLERPIGKLAR